MGLGLLGLSHQKQFVVGVFGEFKLPPTTRSGKIAKRIGTRLSALHSTTQRSIFEGSLAE